MPVLQKAISDMFSHCDILNSLNPEEVIAIGAAKQVGGGSFPGVLSLSIANAFSHWLTQGLVLNISELPSLFMCLQCAPSHTASFQT